MSEDQHLCAVCAHQRTSRMLCVDCSENLRLMLTEIPEFYALAAGEFFPQGQGSGGKSTEVPLGFRVSALDGRTSRDALETLESWERCLRDDLTPGEDSDRAQRRRKAARWADSDSDDHHGVNLCGVVDWLVRHLERIACEFPAVDELYAEVKALHKSARSAAREPVEDVTVIGCPADHGDSICGKRLKVTAEADVTCPRCGAEWSFARLLAVANFTEAESWQTAAFISERMGIPERTLRHWAATGQIRRRGPLLEWSSVVAHREGRYEVVT